MKTTGTCLIILGIIMVLCALFIFPAKQPINAVDSEYPAVPIAGTGYFPWKVFAGFVVLSIGSVFRFAGSIDQQPHSNQR